MLAGHNPSRGHLLPVRPGARRLVLGFQTRQIVGGDSDETCDRDQTGWRWGQSAANPRLLRESLSTTEIQGTHPDLRPSQRVAGRFRIPRKAIKPVRNPDAMDPKSPVKIGYFPEEGETTWKIARVPGLVELASLGAAATTLLDEIRAHFDPHDPEMHTTDTIDYVLVLSGTADLELDDGAEFITRVSRGVTVR